jgi:hypothetical protein
LKTKESQKQEEKGDTKEEEKRVILTVGNYDFHECPVAYTLTDRWAMTLISLVNWSEDMHTPLVDGGLVNYTNWYFECRNIIVSEQRKIENEEMESNRNKGSIGKHGNSGRKPGMGRKGGKAAGKGIRKPSRARRW